MDLDPTPALKNDLEEYLSLLNQVAEKRGDAAVALRLAYELGVPNGDDEKMWDVLHNLRDVEEIAISAAAKMEDLFRPVDSAEGIAATELAVA